MTNITAFTPGGKTANPTTHTSGRRGVTMTQMHEDHDQAEFLRGYMAGQRRTEVNDRIVDFSAFALAFAIGAFIGAVAVIFSL